MKSKTMKVVKDWGISLAIAAVLVFVINTYVAQAVVVPSGSMETTVMIDDHLIIEKISRYTGGIKFGDILVFLHDADNDGEERFLKRLIGLPGDTIEVRDGKLVRNGEFVEEPYLHGLVMNYTYGPVTVPEDCYFFMGDNRNISHDSHRWVNPYVPEDELIGRVIFRYFPFNRIGTVD